MHCMYTESLPWQPSHLTVIGGSTFLAPHLYKLANQNLLKYVVSGFIIGLSSPYSVLLHREPWDSPFLILACTNWPINTYLVYPWAIRLISHPLCCTVRLSSFKCPPQRTWEMTCWHTNRRIEDPPEIILAAARECPLLKTTQSKSGQLTSKRWTI